MRQPGLKFDWWTRVAWGLLILVFLVHWAVIARYAVDVPHMDSWEHLRQPDGLAGLHGSWLIAAHNEHRIVITRLLTYLFYALSDWNVAQVIVFNFALYGTLVGALGWVIHRKAPELPQWALPLGLSFLLSTTAWENHLWDFQNQIHSFLLFGILANGLCFYPGRKKWQLGIGVGAALLALLSFSAGFFLVAALTLVLGLRGVKDRWQKGQWPLADIVACGILAAALMIFLWQYQPVNHPTLSDQKLMPWSFDFWYFTMNMISGGFGYQMRTAVPALVATLILLVPAVACWRQPAAWRNGHWLVASLLLGLLLTFVVITYSRGAYGLWASKSSRYMEFSALLVPLAIALVSLTPWSQVWRTRAIVAVLLFAAMGNRNDWNFPRVYAQEQQKRLAALECLAQYYRGAGDGLCPDSYPEDITQLLQTAERLNLSFVQKIKQGE